MIQVRGLKMYYNYGKIKALDGLDIDINRGDVMVVIGPSGSGKSTFLRSLNLLESPTDGSIIFEDKDIVNEKINTVRRWGWCSSTSISFHTRRSSRI